MAEALRSNTTLLTLDLRANDLSDDSIYLLMNVLSSENGTLKSLNLSDNNITDVGAEYLAEMLKTNDKLTHLWLDTNHIDDRGAGAIALALTTHNSTLEQLYLNWNELISDMSTPLIVSMLKHNQSLTRFEISNCDLSQASKGEILCVEKPENFKLQV